LDISPERRPGVQDLYERLRKARATPSPLLDDSCGKLRWFDQEVAPRLRRVAERARAGPLDQRVPDASGRDT